MLVMAMADSRNLRTVLRYAAWGWAVLPIFGFSGGKCACGNADCPSPGKHPRTNRGRQSSEEIHLETT